MSVKSESFFDKIHTSLYTPPSSTEPSDKYMYYHCFQKPDESNYTCKAVTGNHRIVPVDTSLPAKLHAKLLETILKGPVSTE